MTIPDAVEAPSGEVPTAQPIEFRPGSEPGLAAVEKPTIDNGPIRSGSPRPPRKSLDRLVMAVSGVVMLVSAGSVLSVFIGPAEVGKPEPVKKMAFAKVHPAPTPAPAILSPSPRIEPRPPLDDSSGAASTPKIEVPAPIEVPTPEAQPSTPPMVARPLVIHRRQLLGQEALRERLSQLPEVMLLHKTESALLARHGLQPTPPRNQVAQVRIGGNRAQFIRPSPPAQAPRSENDGGNWMHVAHKQDNSLATVALFKQRQRELGFLSWRLGEECHLDLESAEGLEIHSRFLRDQVQAAIPPGDNRPDPDTLRALLFEPAQKVDTPQSRTSAKSHVRLDVPGAIPALMQLLMAERTPARLLLVEALDRIKGPAASKALARLAMFDLAPEVRDSALVALNVRPAEEFRSTLIEGLRYPWAPVADHSAEALVSLEDREVIPELVAILDEPDPEHPKTETRDDVDLDVIRTVVQVNHLRNCLLCHAPSTSPTTDLVRGQVPPEGLPLPPPRQYYGGSMPGVFIRADVTYLRQDFSVAQPVEDPGPWPAYQRYDYVVSERVVTKPHNPEPKPKEEVTFPQRESVLFALRGLTGEDYGRESSSWKEAIRPKPPAEQ